MVKHPNEKDVAAFFANQEKQISLFMAVKQMLHSIGPVKMDVLKTVISFGTNSKFAWVWEQQPWVNRPPENNIVLTFCVGRYIENDQIVEVVEPYPGRWVHHVIIQSEADLNEHVNQWLREAYTFSLARGKKADEGNKL